ncbi:aspartate-semialdehyde dehydrogenase [Chloroflexota bacterium]
MGYNVAVLGATGLVGQEFLKVLEQRRFPIDSLKLLASARSAGKKLVVLGTEHVVEEAKSGCFEGIDIAFFSAGGEASRHFTPIAICEGATVVDNSSAYRMEPDVPLVVPEVNPEDVKKHKGIVANPNCSTIQMVVALAPLHAVNPIKRVVVDTYQAVAGTGVAALEELRTQSRLFLDGESIVPHVYSHQIAFNVLPEIDVFLDSGYTKEEQKMILETKKIMHAPDTAVSATCVRVPVFIGHSEAVHVEFSSHMSVEQAVRILSTAPGVKVIDDPSVSMYPQALVAAGTDEVYVGRLRQDLSHPNGLAMWVVADNLRKGAALNAVQITEKMIENNWIRRQEG